MDSLPLESLLLQSGRESTLCGFPKEYLILHRQLEGKGSAKSPLTPQWSLGCSLGWEKSPMASLKAKFCSTEKVESAGGQSRESSTACWEAKNRIRSKSKRGLL